MDSREIHQQLHHQQQPPPPPPGMVMGHNNTSFLQNPNSVASQPMHHLLLPFGSILQPQHHHHPQHQRQQQHEHLGFDGSPSSLANRFGIEQEHQQQQVKKKRGRPRKYAPDGNIALGLASTPSNSYGGGDGDSGGANANSSDLPAKRNRGRPPGSGKKQLDALGALGGIGFVPHVIEVKPGEDIAMKVMEFTRQGPRAVCIISASGAVSSTIIRQAINSSGVVKHEEGPYEIVSLKGQYLKTESNDGDGNKSGSLSVSLARPDGRVVGGIVVGMLVAATQVQVIVGSFLLDGGKKQKASTVGTPEPASASARQGSPRSQGQQQQQHSSDTHTSEEKESNSPLHHGNNNNHGGHGLFGNSTAQQMHQMSMQYHHLWPSSNS